MDICRTWYDDYQKRFKENIDLYNTNTEEFYKKIVGWPLNLCARRYAEIHGCVERMGGWANFRA